ncbi:WEB family protein At1g75720-like isoform X1 [Prosopis cineraria]|uniref:WEB family protein At1g75720-like isoform X1 n=1 Tax=Prosopis cineraria TaxID=364024 RepID=UPI002410AF02|nr:WEB family protein At1g75720-like isoform X1 [Prosopis cineraria]
MFTKAAEIDTRAPFRSVKDAVSLFGEKVLAQELHATQLEEQALWGCQNIWFLVVLVIQDKSKGKAAYDAHIHARARAGTEGRDENGMEESSRVGRVAVELEETRQNLERAREESMLMAHCLSSLQEELERTKQELQQLRQRENEEKHAVECEIEDVKFVENLSKSDQERVEFQKKRYVTLRILPPWLTSFTHRVLRSWRGILPSGRRRRTL